MNFRLSNSRLSRLAGQEPPGLDLIILGVLTAPFLLNDFANIYVQDHRLWLIIDYVAVKAFPLGFICYLLRTKKISYADLGVKAVHVGPLILWTMALTVLGTMLDQFGSRFFARILPDTRIGGFPGISNPLVNQIDLYFGLALVGLVEEVVFRGLYFPILARHLSGVGRVFATSAVVFGAIHWSLGLSAIIHTAMIGAVFMVSMWKTGSVLPTIIAHFFVNYLAFSGFIKMI